MAFKFVVVCALFAATNAGGVSPGTYTQYHSSAAVAHPSSEEASHYPKSVVSQIHHIPVQSNIVHYASPVHTVSAYSAPSYSASGYYHQDHQGRSLGYSVPSVYAHIDEPSSTPSSLSKETTTSTEPTTTESYEAATEEANSSAKSSESEPKPTAGAYTYTSATPTGYTYKAPSASSYKLTPAVASFFKYNSPAPINVQYAVPAPALVKYSAPAHAQTYVKYAAPQQIVHTSYSGAPLQYIHAQPAVPEVTHVRHVVAQPTVFKYAGPSAPTHYAAYHTSQPSHINYLAPAPTTYAKYSAPLPTTYVKYGVASSTAASNSDAAKEQQGSQITKLVRHEESASDKSNESDENQSEQIRSQENEHALHQTSRAYLPPVAYHVAPAQQEQTSVYGHQEGARSHQNNWSSDGAVTHVSFKGFGAQYEY